MAAEIADIAQQNKVAVIFGPEDRGLSNRDLDLCQRLVSILPMRNMGPLISPRR
jgi:tRNA/rRNA methyltransferase